MDYNSYSNIYDAEYNDYRDDALFYIKMAKKLAGPALELGCGTGRVMLELARAGCPVVGLDTSSSMLERLRQKLTEEPAEVQGRVEVFEADMRSFDLEQEFGLIYLPFREFMHLTKIADQLCCLNCCHRHLHQDGRLVINLYDVDLPLITGQTGMDVPLRRQRLGDYTDPETGHEVILTSASAFRWEDHTLLEERFYDRIDEHGRIQERRVVVLTQRWFTRFELQHLFFRAGFRVVSLFGGYNGESKVVAGGESIWVLRPASPDELEEELAFHQDRLAAVRQRRSPRSSSTRSRR